MDRDEFLKKANVATPPDLRKPTSADLLKPQWRTILGTGPYQKWDIPKVISLLSLEAKAAADARVNASRDQLNSLLAEAVQQKTALIQVVSNLSSAGEIRWPILELSKRLYLTLLPGWISINTPKTFINLKRPYPEGTLSHNLDYLGLDVKGELFIPDHTHIPANKGRIDLQYLPKHINWYPNPIIVDKSLPVKLALSIIYFLPGGGSTLPLLGDNPLPKPLYREFLSLDTSSSKQVETYMERYAWGSPFGSWPIKKVCKYVAELQQKLKETERIVADNGSLWYWQNHDDLPLIEYGLLNIDSGLMGQSLRESLDQQKHRLVRLCQFYSWFDYFRYEQLEYLAIEGISGQRCPICGRLVTQPARGRKREYCNHPDCVKGRQRDRSRKSRMGKPMSQ